MITAEQIMNGALGRTKKTFNVKEVGEIQLHRLPLNREIEAQKAIAPKSEVKAEALEAMILDCCYFMINGKFDKRKSKNLLTVLDETQLTNIFSTGLYFTSLDVDSIEQTEKN